MNFQIFLFKSLWNQDHLQEQDTRKGLHDIGKPREVFPDFFAADDLCVLQRGKKSHKSGSAPNSLKCFLLILYLYKMVSKIPLSK